MCNTVLINGVVCETIGELGEHLDHLKLVNPWWNRDSCLCNVDIEASAKQCGYSANVYYDQVADYKLEKIE